MRGVKVYVLFHADIEDDRYVRGVYVTRELAEEALVWDEVLFGKYWKGHHESCCSVDEMELLDHLELPFHGPEPVSENVAGSLFPPAVADAFVRSLAAPRWWNAIKLEDPK